ncbi:DEAD/DEAH box helicase family protein [Thermodesulfobacteriota bacterium]
MQETDLSYLVTGGAEDPLLPHLLRAIDSATTIRIAVAFTSLSGLRLIIGALEDALSRQVPLEFLTSDYLDVTEPDALRRLMLLKDAGGVVKVHAWGNSVPFHPKAYIFIQNKNDGLAFVGSSNLSRNALLQGIEWNLCIDNRQSPQAFSQACKTFAELFAAPAAHELTWEWIDRYELRRSLPLDISEKPLPPPEPHEIQKRALEALRDSRFAGMRRALVVLATGVGKTWLAVFDILQGSYGRILFVAHREEILNQAAETFQRVMPRRKAGFYHGGEKSTEADILFGSVQSLGQKTHLRQFARDTFDYIVIDEFHHASASSYQNILNHFTPAFLLGLTATPERTDGRDIEALCDNNLVFRFDLGEAIETGHLCPFIYYGIHDLHVDYENIPWRSRSFKPEEIENALETEARAEQIFTEWHGKGQTRSLGFCVSINHAEYMAAFFVSRGVEAVAVHSRSATRRNEALASLTTGQLLVVFCVDLFNEGVDIPSVDTVMMIRPTESPVVYLQQLGRGLRLHTPEKKLVVLDFIGNHRSFLLGPQALFGLRPGTPEFADALISIHEGTFPLPRGCEINFDLKVIDLLRQMARVTRNPERIYEYLKDLNGRRPTALEMSNYGITFAAIRKNYGSWVQMIHDKGDLAPDLFKQLFTHLNFFREMEKTSLNKSFKLITLEAMVELGGFTIPPTTEVLADKALAVLLRRPALLDDLHEKFTPPQQISETMIDEWHRYWLENPINAFVGGNLKKTQRERVFFSVNDEKFTYTNRVSEEALDLFEMFLQEIVNCRLVGYNPAVHTIDEVVCKLMNSGTSPIIKLNDRLRNALPEGEAEVEIEGRMYRFRFAKIAVNVIMDESGTNVIADILRNWFGEKAGMPGEMQQVRFNRDGDRWQLLPVAVQGDSSPVEPEHGEDRLDLYASLIEDPPPEERFRSCVPFYSLRPAAGRFGLDPGAPLDEMPSGWIPLHDAQPDTFVLQIAGKSMEPRIPDGSFCLFRAGSALGGSRNGKIVLVRSSGIFDHDTESTFTVKQYFSRKSEDPETEWRHDEIRLVPLNPDFDSIILTPDIAEDFTVIGEFIRVVDESNDKG